MERREISYDDIREMDDDELSEFLNAVYQSGQINSMMMCKEDEEDEENEFNGVNAVLEMMKMAEWN